MTSSGYVYTMIGDCTIDAVEYITRLVVSKRKEAAEMEPEVLYSDKLVEITKDSILFRNYHFPFGSRRVSFSEVEGVVVNEPTLRNGKWRIHGTQDFLTWYPRDWRRPSRDRMFLLSFPNRRRRIGFTVEDSETVTNILSGKGVIRQE